MSRCNQTARYNFNKSRLLIHISLIILTTDRVGRISDKTVWNLSSTPQATPQLHLIIFLESIYNSIKYWDTSRCRDVLIKHGGGYLQALRSLCKQTYHCWRAARQFERTLRCFVLTSAVTRPLASPLIVSSEAHRGDFVSRATSSAPARE